MDSTSPPLPLARLYFLDWLRILAFALLVPYHVGMYYVTWDWHVKSPAASTLIEPLMMLSSPWRLSLLFFIAGAATQMMWRRNGSAGFVGRRSRQLLWPLLFGMGVVVPPQAYYEVVSKLSYAGSYVDFMRLYLTGYGGTAYQGTNGLSISFAASGQDIDPALLTALLGVSLPVPPGLATFAITRVEVQGVTG
eukprot:gene3682-4873_t